MLDISSPPKGHMMRTGNEASDPDFRQALPAPYKEGFCVGDEDAVSASCPTMRKVKASLWGLYESSIMGRQFLVYCAPEVIFDKKSRHWRNQFPERGSKTHKTVKNRPTSLNESVPS